MKKIGTFIIILLTLFMLTGCTQAKVKYEIDDTFNVILHYTATIDLSDFDKELSIGIKGLVHRAVKDYVSRGFKSNTEFSDNSIQLDLRLTKENDNLENAYQTLNEILIDTEISFFLSVDMSTKTEKFLSALVLELETDLPLIIDSTRINDLPPTIKNTILDNINTSNIELEFVLPTSTVVEKSGSISVSNSDNKTIFNSIISNDSSTIFRVVTKTSLDNGKFLSKDFENSIIESENKLNIYTYVLYILGILILVNIIGLVLYIRKSKYRYY